MWQRVLWAIQKRTVMKICTGSITDMNDERLNKQNGFERIGGPIASGKHSTSLPEGILIFVYGALRVDTVEGLGTPKR